jgi:CRP-like cAMP-binding protein
MLPSPFHDIPDEKQSSKRVQKGETLFLQGDPCQGLYFLKLGKIELRRYSADGEVAVVHKAFPGTTFAEASLFTDSYHCDALALANSVVIQIERHYLLERQAKDAVFASALLSTFARQIQFYRRKIEILSIQSAEQRVLSALKEGWLTGSIIDFASELGLSHEATYRALASLTKQGSVKKSGRGTYQI